MGVWDLLPFLAAKAPSALRPAGEVDLAGMRAAVDVPIQMYVAAYAKRSVEPADLCGWFERLHRQLGRASVTPVYVFDGAKLEAKAKESARRVEVMVKAGQRAATARARYDAVAGAAADALVHAFAAGGEAEADADADADALSAAREEVEKAEARLARPTREHYDLVRAHLTRLGAACVVAPTEAEKECARMGAAGEVGVVVTNDSDALPFGAPLTLFNYGRPNAYAVDLPALLAALELDLRGFRELCVMCGCDFVCRVPNVGPYRAHALLLKHGSIAAVLEAQDRARSPHFCEAAVAAAAAAAGADVAALSSQVAALEEAAPGDKGEPDDALAAQLRDTRARLAAARTARRLATAQLSGLREFKAGFQAAYRIFAEPDLP